mgnify:CR=1 FL=1
MFAKVYDVLMSDVDYDALFEWIKPHLKKADNIIDAGCGTGYFLKTLIEHDYDAIGVDIDDEMLAIALNRLKDNNLKAPLYHHDLRNPMHLKVDVIISLFDVMNYFKGVKTVISQIKKSLNQHGLFIFDVYKYDVLNHYDGYHEIESDPITYDWKINRDQERLIHKIKVEGYTHVQVQYIKPLSYYEKVLNEIGFKSYIVLDGPDERKHYIIASL